MGRPRGTAGGVSRTSTRASVRNAEGCGVSPRLRPSAGSAADRRATDPAAKEKSPSATVATLRPFGLSAAQARHVRVEARRHPRRRDRAGVLGGRGARGVSRYVGLRSSAEKLGVEMAVPLAAATRLLVLPFELPASAVGLNHLVAEERSAVPEAD